jgi:hypothetical protein
MKTLIRWFSILRRVGQKAGPYLVLEMLLPGGTLFALLLFLYRRKKSGMGGGTQGAVAAAMHTLASVFDKGTLLPAPIRLVLQRSTTMRSES